MRAFEFALNKDGSKQYESAKIPVYQTKNSAGADFYCAEAVIIPSVFNLSKEYMYKPTLVHTGIKANMNEDEVLELYNRSSNPGKLGLILANSVGVVDADYYNNPDNDGEIMFAFYNMSDEDIYLQPGDRIGQGVFKKFLKPENAIVNEKDRTGGFGSTDNSTDKQ